MAAAATLDYEAMGEPELLDRLTGGDSLAARLVIKRNNQRLFRAAWSVLRNRAEAEEAVQEGYLKAFAAIHRFERNASIATWLTRIVVNESISRLRSARRRARRLKAQGMDVLQDYRDRVADAPSLAGAPDEALMRRELAGLLERAISRLPEPFRLVFVLHEIEGLSADEISAAIGEKPETVRTRLFRARRRLQEDLGPELRRTLGGTIVFAGADCDALTERVLAAWQAQRRS